MCNEIYTRANGSWAISAHIYVPAQGGGVGRGGVTFTSNEIVGVNGVLQFSQVDLSPL